jgi:polysaccharide pyruvyl transferase WcaK-like protein
MRLNLRNARRLLTRGSRDQDRIALLSPAVGTGNVGDTFIEEAVLRLLDEDMTFERFSIRRPMSRRDVARINGARCALVTGTNLYQRRWEPALDVPAVSRITVPIVPVGVGGSAARADDIGVGPTTEVMIRALHDRCVVGGVRDPHGEAVVRAAGVDNVLLTGCPVLFWRGAEELPVAASRERVRVILTARNWLMHREPDNVDHPVQVEFLRSVLKELAGNEVLFAVHADVDARLVPALGLPDRMVFRSDRLTDYVALYTDTDSVVLASRLHAGMLAVANGVPTVFVGHDSRTYSFCEMLGLNHIELFAPDSAEQAITSLGAVLNGAPALPASAIARFRELRQAMDEFLSANDLPRRHRADHATDGGDDQR